MLPSVQLPQQNKNFWIYFAIHTYETIFGTQLTC